MAIDLTKEELSVCIQLFDIAVKAGGLQVADAALTMARKFQEAAKEEITDVKNNAE